MSQDVGRNALGLKMIGGFKFACGLLLVALGIGLFRGLGDDPGAEAGHIVAALKLDPDSRYIHALISRVSNVTPGQLRALGVGTFLYALLYLVEGGGLLAGKHWAEYLTVVATGLFIPLELYEVGRKPTPIRIALLAINAAIVAYLVYQLRRKDRASATASPPAGTVEVT